MTRSRAATPQETGDSEDRLVEVQAPEVPPDVRTAVLKMMQSGDQLWRCPRLAAPRGLSGLLGLHPRDAVIEWWLVDAQGHLVEAFWQAT